MCMYASYSLETDFVLNGVNAGVQADSVLLEHDFLLDDGVHLLLKEVALVDVVDLKFEVILFKVVDVLNDFLQDVVSGFSGMMLQGGALTPQKLHIFLVVVQHLDGFLGAPLKQGILR